MVTATGANGKDNLLTVNFGNDDIPQELSIMKELENYSEEDLEEKVNRQIKDEQFRRQEERRKANNQLKETDK